MDIKTALKLQPGAMVRFPADRGDLGGTGCVSHVSSNIATHMGKQFIWVTIRTGTHQATWPSNRLELLA